MPTKILDCVIVGGGPAGLTAALYLARFLRSVTVIDAQDGRAGLIPRTHNLAAFPDGISGRDLLGRMRQHAEFYGAVIETGVVHTVDRNGEFFHVATDNQVTLARNIILATGVFNHRPPLAPPDHDQGLERGLIRYCPICDAHEVQGKRIAVLGDATHGFQEAKFLRHYSASVTLIPPDGRTAVARDGVSALESAMTTLGLSDGTVEVMLENGEIAQFDTLYVALGTSARTQLGTQLGLERDKDGCIKTNDQQKTSSDRIYAVGDIVAGLDQIAVAMGQGAVAATKIHNDLS